MTKNTDQKILQLLQEHPEEGMSLLIEQSMGLLWSACRLYLSNPEDIRECVQDTLLDFYEHRDRFQVEQGTIKAYLYVIAKRKAIHKARKNHTYAVEELSETVPDIDNEEQILDRIVLEQALSQLKEQDSRMIRMRYYEGMTCSEIAHRMNLPVETVKKRQQRSLKKLQKILIALVLLGLLTACAAGVIYRYRFSPATGFQEQDTDIWMEMADDPMTIQTEESNVTLQNVIWKERRLILDLDVENIELRDQHLDIRVFIDETGQTRTSRSQTVHFYDENEPLDVKTEFQNINSADQFTFWIFGSECTVDMKPVGQYEYFQDIGNSQTHNGRTIVLQQAEDGQTVNAYTCSEDTWKIIDLGYFMESDSWSRERLTDGYYFQSKLDTATENADTIRIPAILIRSENDTPIIQIPVPEDTLDVNIPFTLGGDTYRVSNITYSRDTFEYGIVDENGQETTAYGDELLIQVEPVVLEQNTRIIAISAELGELDTRYSYQYNPETKKQETIDSWEEFRHIYADNMFREYEPVIRMQLSEDENLADEVHLRIQSITKEWDQPYVFHLTPIS